MGYTHYWEQSRGFTDQEWATLTQYARKVVQAAEKRGIKLAGSLGDGSPLIGQEGIYLNGRSTEAYETFALDCVPRESFNFCKTQYRPYDPVVVTILVAAATIAPNAITIYSDGGAEALVPQFTDAVEMPEGLEE